MDGIPPRLLKETVEQMSIPLARVFSLSLKEGMVPSEWEEANIIPLFKSDHMVDFLVRHKLLYSSQHRFLKVRSC